MLRDSDHRLRVVGVLSACVVLLAACAAPGTGTKAPATEPQKPVPSAAPAPAVVEPSPAAAPAPAIVVTPATIQLAQRLAQSAVEMLEGGNEEQATAELQRALQNDPNNKLAQSLLRQIQSDPVGMLGRENFSYRVQPGESISRIAQRFLGDVHLFYALARYNDLKVPRMLQAGQTIKVPGKAPPVSAPAVAAPAPAAQPAAAPASPAAASRPAADDPKAAERERRARITAATRAARSAFARQDLVTAIQQWDLVLELDPGNAPATLERQRAVDLKAKLDQLPKKP